MEQTFIAGLAIGLLVGWLVEYLIDIFYWRRGNSASGLLKQQLVDADMSLATANQHIATLSAELEQTNQALVSLRAQNAVSPTVTTIDPMASANEFMEAASIAHIEHTEDAAQFDAFRQAAAATSPVA